MNCLVRPENYAKKVSIENGIDYGEEDVVVKKKKKRNQFQGRMWKLGRDKWGRKEEKKRKQISTQEHFYPLAHFSNTLTECTGPDWSQQLKTRSGSCV